MVEVTTACDYVGNGSGDGLLDIRSLSSKISLMLIKSGSAISVRHLCGALL